MPDDGPSNLPLNNGSGSSNAPPTLDRPAAREPGRAVSDAAYRAAGLASRAERGAPTARGPSTPATHGPGAPATSASGHATGDTAVHPAACAAQRPCRCVAVPHLPLPRHRTGMRHGGHHAHTQSIGSLQTGPAPERLRAHVEPRCYRGDRDERLETQILQKSQLSSLPPSHLHRNPHHAPPWAILCPRAAPQLPHTAFHARRGL
ncbi:hypothetical protein K438DRAFT_2148754 [Mycena galopus ATCC 62051]|nr:hypothetical protein K438DRAFT_2148754 [Mycena galopus ATCC 62051]